VKKIVFETLHLFFTISMRVFSLFASRIMLNVSSYLNALSVRTNGGWWLFFRGTATQPPMAKSNNGEIK